MVTTGLEIIAFMLLVVDTLAGLFICILLNFRVPWDVLNAFLFTFALPLSLVKFWSRRAALILLWGLFFLRWLIQCFDGKSPALLNPIAWPPGPFLFAGVLMLQIAYLLVPSRDK
jgi:hypothetical protein